MPPNALLILAFCAFTVIRTIVVVVGLEPSQTGFAILHVKNPEKPPTEENGGVDVCVNFPASEERPLPAQSFHLVWWDLRFGNTAICQRQLTTPVPRLDQNEILPIMYETVPLKFRQPCRVSPQFKYTDNPLKYQVDIATDAGAHALLFIVERGAENVNGTHDYLHSRFCNPGIQFRTNNNNNNNETSSSSSNNGQHKNTTNVFFIFRDAFDQFVVPKLRETPNAELRFRKPVEADFDFSKIFLWLLLLLAVALGSLWSARAARDRFEGKNSRRGAEGIELRRPGERAADDTGGGAEGGEQRSSLHILLYVCAIFLGVLLYVTVFAKWHALIMAIVWTLLGIFCVSKCLFALCKYMVFPYRRGEQQRVLVNFRDYRLTPLGIFCYLMAMAICLPWFLLRHHPYAFLPLNVINLGICVFFIKYFTFEPLLAGYALKHQIIYSTIFFVIGLLFAAWKFVHPLMLECTQNAPIDVEDQQIAAFLLPKFNDPLRVCWDPLAELGYRHTAISLFPIVFSAFFVPFWFFIDMINAKRVYAYGIAAFVGFALGWLLFLVVLAQALNLQLAHDFTPFALVLPLPVWFGTLWSLVQHTTRKLWAGQLQF